MTTMTSQMVTVLAMAAIAAAAIAEVPSVAPSENLQNQAKVPVDSSHIKQPAAVVSAESVPVSPGKENLNLQQDSKITDDLVLSKKPPDISPQIVGGDMAHKAAIPDTKLNEVTNDQIKLDTVKVEGNDRHPQEPLGVLGDPQMSLSMTPSMYDEDSHVFILFTIGMLLCAMGYAVFHNKRKILALIIEGRNSHGEIRRGGGGINYKRVNMSEPGSNGETISVA